MFINSHLISFAAGNGIKIIKTCLLQLILTVLATIVSLCSAFVVRMLMGESKVLFFTQVWQVIIVIAFLVVLRFFISKIKTMASEECSLMIKESLRMTLLTKLFSLGPVYTGKERTGNTASTISTKVEYLNEYYTIYLPQAVSTLVNSILLIFVLIRFNRLTAVICIIACIGTYVCPMIFYFLMRKRGEEEMQAHSDYYSDCLDSIQGIQTLKAFNANKRQCKIIHEKGEHLRQAVMRQLRVTMLENVVLQFFTGLGSAFSIAFAAFQCANGYMKSADLVYALFLIGACFAPVAALINAWHFGYRGVVASYSIIELLQEQPKLSLSVAGNLEAKHQNSLFNGEICFKDVSFAYEPEEGNVLENVSFSIPFQTTTALVGASGSGKSTIAHLLAGFYPVNQGKIAVGDKILSEENVCQIQELISAVWQDCRLFYGTVEDNIMIGKPSATSEEVFQAAKDANIHDFIMSLPEGYKTMIGERGMRFSGGERQRIAIARAFLRNSPIVILDEATSSLDRHNEIEIQQSIRQLSRGKTCLVIAHRLATIQSADQIIIMDKGRILEKGTHEELMMVSENYRTLMGNQMMGGRKIE